MQTDSYLKMQFNRQTVSGEWRLFHNSSHDHRLLIQVVNILL